MLGEEVGGGRRDKSAKTHELVTTANGSTRW